MTGDSRFTFQLLKPQSVIEMKRLLSNQAAAMINDARELVAIREWCLKKFGEAPPLPDHVRAMAAMEADDLLEAMKLDDAPGDAR